MVKRCVCVQRFRYRKGVLAGQENDAGRARYVLQKLALAT